MDQKDACYCHIIDQTDNQTRNCYLKKTLQFLVPISVTYFLVSYFSVFPIIFHQLHFCSSIYPFLAQALDRKCMFLLFNGILAFLKLNTSPLNYGGFSKSFDGQDGADQLPEMPVFQENAPYVDHIPSHAAIPEEKVIQEVPQHQNHVVSREVENETVMLDSQEWEEDDYNKEEEEEEEEEEVVEQTTGVEDMRVSTEDLNKKFDEFIRKMKEEIRNTV